MGCACSQIVRKNVPDGRHGTGIDGAPPFQGSPGMRAARVDAPPLTSGATSMTLPLIPRNESKRSGPGVGRVSLPERATFTADRPFLVVVRDNPTGAVLFLGQVTSP